MITVVNYKCTKKDPNTAETNTFFSLITFIGDYFGNPIIEPSIAGLDVNEFNNIYLGKFSEPLPFGTMYGPTAYDAVWSLALAFNKTLQKMEQLGKDRIQDYFCFSN